MPGMDGIEAAGLINELKINPGSPYIVFITSKDHLVFDALKQFPYSFIRKTHFNEDIKMCILSLNKRLANEVIRYPVKIGRNTTFLDTESIIYIEKDKNYVVFHTDDFQYKERSNIDEKLKDLSPRGFIRTHIGYLVNPKYILEITGTEVKLKNAKTVPVSKNYKQSVKDKYFEWMAKQND